MKYLLSIIILFAIAHPASAAIYKCVSHSGKQTFSDLPCQHGATEIQLNHKKIPWTKALDKRKPERTKIIETYKDKGDTLIRYRFGEQEELQSFMRSARRLSGQYVTALDVKPPKDGMYGEALVRVSKKKFTPEKTKTPK